MSCCLLVAPLCFQPTRIERKIRISIKISQISSSLKFWKEYRNICKPGNGVEDRLGCHLSRAALKIEDYLKAK
ncbi:unnamed protein product [Acanthoscelides obtectus]|uniref:Uncharacterized protein n=1 Tax=Acanthoscelides obtectus TaxID=200917 RepID=A0A9P0L694_ACAOB|nr:unnamed protein product [Acanthoscelides obtectus]CAK1630986.1 hypothetical protein AOBTE_LOCUS6693 [Acanthoscelides obtectus]